MNNHERNRSIKGFSSNIVRSTTSRNTPIIWEFFLDFTYYTRDINCKFIVNYLICISNCR